MSEQRKDFSPAEAQIATLIAEFAPAHERLVRDVRSWLRKRLPGAHEIVYEYRDSFVISYSPSEHGYEGVFAIRASAKGVALCFNQAKGLPDPARLLRGSGKLVRSLELESAATLARPEVAALVDAALARNPVPFASADSGSLVVRATTAAKRRQPAKAPS